MMNIAEALYFSLALGGSLTNAQEQADPPGTPAWAASNPMPMDYSQTNLSGRAAVGLKMGRWDLEVGAGNLGRSHQYRQGGPAYDTTGYNITASELDVRARYSLPVGSRFSLYGEGGAALVHYHASQWNYTHWGWTDETRNDVAPQLGIGVAYKLDKHWSISAGVTQTWAPEFSTTQALIGVRYGLK